MLKTGFWALIGALGMLSVSTPAKAESWIFDGWQVQQYNERPHHQHYYGRPAPVYGIPQGVARPHRFVCGNDVFTGQYNCVRKKKAHFVRPLNAPPPGYYRPHPHDRRYDPRW